jgi:hypothetical protein
MVGLVPVVDEQSVARVGTYVGSHAQVVLGYMRTRYKVQCECTSVEFQGMVRRMREKASYTRLPKAPNKVDAIPVYCTHDVCKPLEERIIPGEVGYEVRFCKDIDLSTQGTS